MKSDLKIDIDGVRLNVRVGAIFRHNDDVIIEISKVGLNSVVPGGRIKINEKSTLALKREVNADKMKYIEISSLEGLEWLDTKGKKDDGR